MANTNADIIHGSGSSSAVAQDSAIQAFIHQQQLPARALSTSNAQVYASKNQFQKIVQQQNVYSDVQHPQRIQHLAEGTQLQVHSVPPVLVQSKFSTVRESSNNIVLSQSHNRFMSGNSDGFNPSEEFKSSEVKNAYVNIVSANQSLDVSNMANNVNLSKENRSNLNADIYRLEREVGGNVTENMDKKGSSNTLDNFNVAPGWRRIKYNGEIIYISPSGAPLRTIDQVKEYLLSVGTCKCGLPCPFRPETFFEFDVQVPNILPSLSRSIVNHLCLHQSRFSDKNDVAKQGVKVVSYNQSDVKSESRMESLHQGSDYYRVSESEISGSNSIASEKSIPSTNQVNFESTNATRQDIKQVFHQSAKETVSITRSKTPPWRKNTTNSSTTAVSINHLQQQYQTTQHSQNLSPMKSVVQNVNQIEQMNKKHMLSESANSSNVLQGKWTVESSAKGYSVARKRPNFKDDPTGYLNHQTAMLHNSISTLHSPDGSSSSRESPQLKSTLSFEPDDPANVVREDESNTSSSSLNSTSIGGQTVTHIANGMVQVQLNCDISNLKLQQQLQFQQQLQRQNQLVRQHNEQIQLLQQQQPSTEDSSSKVVRFSSIVQDQATPTSRTPDVTSTSSSTPELKGPIQGGIVTTSDRAIQHDENIVIVQQSRSPDIHLMRSPIADHVMSKPKNNIISDINSMDTIHGLKNAVKDVKIEQDSSTRVSPSFEKIDKPYLQNQSVNHQNLMNVSQNKIGQNQSSIVSHSPQQQVLMTSNGQIIVMSAPSNKHPGQVVLSGNATTANMIIPQQSGTQYLNITGNSAIMGTTVATNANNVGVLQNVAKQQTFVQSNHHSTQEQNFVINSNGMQSTMILNNGNVMQTSGPQVLSASPNNSGNVLSNASGGKVISGENTTCNPSPHAIPSNNTGMILNNIQNSIVIQPNFNNPVERTGQMVSPVINQDAHTLYVQPANQQSQVLCSPDLKRKAKKRKSDGVASTMLSPNSIPQQTAHLSTVTHQPSALPTVNPSRTMLQLTPQYQQQNFQLSSGLQGVTIVPNKVTHQASQQQQIILQNGQIITHPYNIVSQQVLLPAGLVVTPDATLVQIQNMTSCGSVITTPQGMVIRAQSPHQPKSFLSPNPTSNQQFMVNSNGQVSPMAPNTQIYGNSVNIVMPQQQSTSVATASFVQQNAATLMHQQQANMIHQSAIQIAAQPSALNTSSESCSASSSTNDLSSLPITAQQLQHYHSSAPMQLKSQTSSYMSTTVSPPDTTTHSPNSPDCGSSEKSVSSADSLNMAMVQCVSSSEPDILLPANPDGTSSPPETVDYTDQEGCFPQQRTVHKVYEIKPRRLQMPTTTSHQAQRSIVGDNTSGPRSHYTTLVSHSPSPVHSVQTDSHEDES
ncbi:mucin-2 isoform X2 [Uranotaenia lowii]|uniref:mucin-2 isoform X2 n=1 Tax=Uranotaenia lowii TaxID=190385 RepID=UPI002479E738|nr:mucin-2 isoform X2 [Uranotaenia lowii]